MATPGVQDILMPHPTAQQQYEVQQRRAIEAPLATPEQRQAARPTLPWPAGDCTITAPCGCSRFAFWPEGGEPINHGEKTCAKHAGVPAVPEWLRAGALTTHSRFCDCEMVAKWPHGGHPITRVFFPCKSHVGATGWTQ